MQVERQGDYYALACAVACALGNIVVKVGQRNVSTELFNFYFFIFAFVISLVIMGNKTVFKEIKETNLKVVGLIALLTLFFTFGIYTFMHAIKVIEPATVSFISRFEIILTLILAYFFLKERLTKYELIGGLIAVIGVLILKYQTTLEISRAATLMIISAFFFAVAEILVKKFINVIGTMRFIFFRNLFAIGIFYIVLIVKGESVTLPDSKTLVMAFIGALLLPVLGRATFIAALQRIKISRAVLITQAMPILTAIFALIFLGTFPGATEWAGGSLIVLGVLFVKFSESKTRK